MFRVGHAIPENTLGVDVAVLTRMPFHSFYFELGG